jgi:2-methylisocitrate lyase-like PEP mutase family enzyme
MTSQIDRAHTFAALHTAGDPVVLPNVWDAASARIVAESGARAIATTSAGIAWSLGFADGNRLTRDDALSALTRIARVVTVPLTADIERGYGDTARDVGETVTAFFGAGVVGVNLEDSLRPIADQQQRLASAREAADSAGIPLFVNARIDTHSLGDIGGAEWLDETVARALAYERAGASGIFVLGALRAESIRALVDAVALPINVAFGPGTLPIAELALAGASRISAGSSIAESAYSVVGEWASRMSEANAPAAVPAPRLGWAALNSLIAR